MKNFIIFKGNIQKSDISCKIKFGEIRNFLDGTRKAKKLLEKFVNKEIYSVLFSLFYTDVPVTF